MQFLLIFTGLFLISYSIYWLFNLFKCKELYLGNLEDSIIKLQLMPDQLYVLSILGGYYKSDNGFKVKLINKDTNEKIDIKRFKLKYYFKKKRKIGFNHIYFTIRKSNDYALHIENSDKMTLLSSNLFLKNKICKAKGNRNFLIKEGIPFHHLFLSIIAIVIGANSLIFGFFYNYF